MRTTGLMVLAACVACLPLTAAADELTGRQILDQVSDRQDRPYEYEEQVMTLVAQDGSREVRQVRRYKRDVEGGSRSLLVFTDPAGVKGTALLTWQHDKSDDDQWLYLPAMGTMKRIAEGGMRNYFMGTDFTYEDLTSESRDKFKYDRQPDQTLDGQDCYVVIATATDAKLAKETGYKSRTLYIRKDIFFIIRTDYFDRRGRPIKTQSQDKLQHIDGDTWRAQVAIMKNTHEKHITAIQTTSRSFDEKDVPERNFTERFITSGAHVR